MFVLKVQDGLAPLCLPDLSVANKTGLWIHLPLFSLILSIITDLTAFHIKTSGPIHLFGMQYTISIYIYKYIYTYMHTYACVCVCRDVCMYMCVCVFILCWLLWNQHDDKSFAEGYGYCVAFNPNLDINIISWWALGEL